ncbi:hypothetical protein [Tranquillimonas alkanivorans]|nr:hypothetical protein [Tranquillimonas alkanivorans]
MLYVDPASVDDADRLVALASDGLTAARRALPHLERMPADLSRHMPDLVRTLVRVIEARDVFSPVFQEAAIQFVEMTGELADADDDLLAAKTHVGDALEAVERVADIEAARRVVGQRR